MKSGHTSRGGGVLQTGDGEPAGFKLPGLPGKELVVLGRGRRTPAEVLLFVLSLTGPVPHKRRTNADLCAPNRLVLSCRVGTCAGGTF